MTTEGTENRACRGSGSSPGNPGGYRETMKHCLRVQMKRYPLMNEEDVVKFVFQGMLGVGHLIRSGSDALRYLEEELAGLDPDWKEPLTEEISPEWFRMNLRAAKAKGISASETADRLLRSAGEKPQFTRQDVYSFCTELDGSDRMKAAAEKITDETWLPRHSEQYRETYRPAYRVLHRKYGLPGGNTEQE